MYETQTDWVDGKTEGKLLRRQRPPHIEKKKSSNGFYPPVPRLCNSFPIFTSTFFENIHGIHGQQQVGKREHTENSIEEELPCWKFSVGRKKFRETTTPKHTTASFPSPLLHHTTSLQRILKEISSRIWCDIVQFKFIALRLNSDCIPFSGIWLSVNMCLEMN